MIHANAQRRENVRYAGFTLVEMVIAVGIIAAVAGIGTAIANATKVVRDSAYENIAFRIANSKLDDLRAGRYAALPASGPFTDPQLVNVPQGAASTTVTVWNSKTKEVVVGVSWLGINGATRYVSVATLVTQVGGL